MVCGVLFVLVVVSDGQGERSGGLGCGCAFGSRSWLEEAHDCAQRRRRRAPRPRCRSVSTTRTHTSSRSRWPRRFAGPVCVGVFEGLGRVSRKGQSDGGRRSNHHQLLLPPLRGRGTGGGGGGGGVRRRRRRRVAAFASLLRSPCPTLEGSTPEAPRARPERGSGSRLRSILRSAQGRRRKEGEEEASTEDKAIATHRVDAGLVLGRRLGHRLLADDDRVPVLAAVHGCWSFEGGVG